MPFNFMDSTQTGKPVALPPGSTMEEKIKKLISSSPVFLFMKGTPDAPQCGFSANVVKILNEIKVPFNSFDILSNSDIRQGVKEFSNWPTYPQLYIKNEFVGGNDIVTEMLRTGELQKML